MTLIASLLFAIALIASVAVIVLTFSKAMPRIIEVIDMEFAPSVAIPRKATMPADILLAA
jgi:CDP-diglyceride synthetase